MFCNLCATSTIAPPFNAGVRGLLYLAGTSQSGISCPVSIDTDAQWTPVVKASPTAKAVGWVEEHITTILPYVNAQPETAPTLLAARAVGSGRLAADRHQPEWIFQSPNELPPVAEMLSRGHDDTPSNWIRLYANLFRWLGAPRWRQAKAARPTMPSVPRPPPASSALAGWAR